MKKLARIFLAVLLMAAAVLLPSAYNIKTVYYELSSDKIPQAFDGFRIVQISDLHSRDINELIIRAVEKTGADMIVFTGDMIDRAGDRDSVLELFGALGGIAPMYYVTGNHEWANKGKSDYLEELKQSEVRLLRGESVELTRGGESMLLAGVDDPNGPENFAKTGKTLLPPDSDEFSILLAHRPDMFADYAEAGFDLVLSGHKHGGLIRLPIVGGLLDTGMTLLPEFDGGEFSRGGCEMIVSRGLSGAEGIPRVFNRPEIPVIILKCS